MDRVYQANAIETPPSTTASSGSYPTAGNKALGQLATVPGPYWFYSITEEIRNALIAAGVTPDAANVNQLAEAMSKFLPLSGGTMTGTIVRNGFLAQNSVDDNLLIVRGGTDATSAFMAVYGKNHASMGGVAGLVAVKDSQSTGLYVYPDGRATLDGKNVVCVEYWRSGANWYRKYSDGFIEQGGNNTGLSETSTITFHTAFSNTNYQFVWSAVGKADTSSRYYHNIQGRATTTVTIKDHKFGTGCPACVWYACGY